MSASDAKKGLILTVTAGKGGTGQTAVTVSLALSIHDRYRETRLSPVSQPAFLTRFCREAAEAPT